MSAGVVPSFPFFTDMMSNEPLRSIVSRCRAASALSSWYARTLGKSRPVGKAGEKNTPPFANIEPTSPLRAKQHSAVNAPFGVMATPVEIQLTA